MACLFYSPHFCIKIFMYVGRHDSANSNLLSVSQWQIQTREILPDDFEFSSTGTLATGTYIQFTHSLTHSLVGRKSIVSSRQRAARRGTRNDLYCTCLVQSVPLVLYY
jgi:hypothetical protein